LIRRVMDVLEGEVEEEITHRLQRLREILISDLDDEAWAAAVEAARARAINVVNNFFHDRLVAIPPIQEYMESLAGHSASA
jgi:hypothetical protein